MNDPEQDDLMTSYGPHAEQVERCLEVLRKLTPQQWSLVVERAAEAQANASRQRAAEAGPTPAPAPRPEPTPEQRAYEAESKVLRGHLNAHIETLIPADMPDESRQTIRRMASQGMFIWLLASSDTDEAVRKRLEKMFSEGTDFVTRLGLPPAPQSEDTWDIESARERYAIYEGFLARLTPAQWEALAPQPREAVYAARTARAIGELGGGDEAAWRGMAAADLAAALAEGKTGRDLDEAFAPFEGISAIDELLTETKRIGGLN